MEIKPDALLMIIKPEKPVWVKQNAMGSSMKDKNQHRIHKDLYIKPS